MSNSLKLDSNNNLTGLIPCAGFAKRISPLPCSKEIFPVGFDKPDTDLFQGPKVISAYLLERLRKAGAKQAHLIIRKGKWDIPNYYGTGEQFGIPLSYIVVHPTRGASFTVNKAYPFIKNKRVLFGFPDIYFEPSNAYQYLLKHQNNTGSDVVLGLFKAVNTRKVDMVELEDGKKVKNIFIKPDETDLAYTWMIAVWTPRFSEFLHLFLAEFEDQQPYVENDFTDEIHIGHLFQKAIEAGLHISSVSFPDGRYIDIGTQQYLKKAIQLLNPV